MLVCSSTTSVRPIGWQRCGIRQSGGGPELAAVPSSTTVPAPAASHLCLQAISGSSGKMLKLLEEELQQLPLAQQQQQGQAQRQAQQPAHAQQQLQQERQTQQQQPAAQLWLPQQRHQQQEQLPRRSEQLRLLERVSPPRPVGMPKVPPQPDWHPPEEQQQQQRQPSLQALPQHGQRITSELRLLAAAPRQQQHVWQEAVRPPAVRPPLRQLLATSLQQQPQRHLSYAAQEESQRLLQRQDSRPDGWLRAPAQAAPSQPTAEELAAAEQMAFGFLADNDAPADDAVAGDDDAAMAATEAAATEAEATEAEAAGLGQGSAAAPPDDMQID